MKATTLIGFKKLAFLALATLPLLISACKKNNTAEDLTPTISGVTDLNNRAITLGSSDYGDWIMIKGTNLATSYKVDFNTVLAADSLIYSDDSSVTVKIPGVLPDPANNPITVTTKYGVATYNYKILQPAPLISSFSPSAGPSGQEVTIVGNYFGGVESVKIGTVNASIVSSTKEQIKITVPAGVNYGYIYVSTPSGTVKSAHVYGFLYQVYDDALTSTWYTSSWSGTTDAASTANVERGVNSIMHSYTSGFGGFRVSKNSPSQDLTGATGIKFSLYAGPESLGKKIKLYLNGISGSGYTFTIGEVGKWVKYQVEFKNLGNPTVLTSIALQEFSSVVRVVYFDDIGVY